MVETQPRLEQLYAVATNTNTEVDVEHDWCQARCRAGSTAPTIRPVRAYRIGPFEVESALIEHEAVAESAVIGKPDPDRGQIVKAFVVLRAGHPETEKLVSAIQDHVKRVTAPYKYPREIEFVETLPKTRSGKIRRVELRRLEEERSQRSL
jgi:acyl-coenzyme A synthetase/AMP-(fatty) acid ligase